MVFTEAAHIQERLDVIVYGRYFMCVLLVENDCGISWLFIRLIVAQVLIPCPPITTMVQHSSSFFRLLAIVCYSPATSVSSTSIYRSLHFRVILICFIWFIFIIIRMQIFHYRPQGTWTTQSTKHTQIKLTLQCSKKIIQLNKKKKKNLQMQYWERRRLNIKLIK